MNNIDKMTLGSIKVKATSQSSKYSFANDFDNHGCGHYFLYLIETHLKPISGSNCNVIFENKLWSISRIFFLCQIILV